jgi:hypothetical protein
MPSGNHDVEEVAYSPVGFVIKLKVAESWLCFCFNTHTSAVYPL